MIGYQLDHFQITEELGEGGMGRVYRARDLKLRREVAIKLLPEAFAADAERRARFEREARLLAALNHANIAGIYDLGEARAMPGIEAETGTNSASEGNGRLVYLVMELVPGETLADRIGRGPAPWREVAPIALQIAAALEAAHAKGIVHRDLKPANVKIAPDGQVKVLDFGLARAFETAQRAQNPALVTQSPTLTAQMTGAGVILGTAAYMSPEQAKGEEADQRSDIWSFGVVLTELLLGRRVFDEPTVSETLASVLKSDAGLERLPGDIPTPIRRLLDRCLRKESRERFQDVADVRLALEDAADWQAEAPMEAPRTRAPRASLGWLVAGVLIGALGVLALRPGTHLGETGAVARSYVIEYGDFRESRPSLSPDGNRVAYSKGSRIWVRDLRRLESIPVPGTEGGQVPFWSPDGQWLGFAAEGSLWKIHLDGSAKTEITNLAPGVTSGGAAWTSDDRIVFDTGSSEIFQVSARGGDYEVLVPLEEGEVDFHDLVLLPDGAGLLTVVHRGDAFDNIQWIAADGSRREILSTPGQAVGQLSYSPTGHVLFSRWPDFSLWAAPFSPKRDEVTGKLFPVGADGMYSNVSPDGTLVYVSVVPRIEGEVVAVDRRGQVLERYGEPMKGFYPSPALSPDGDRVVVPVRGHEGFDLWALDLANPTPRRLTFDGKNQANYPSFGPDGDLLYYGSFRSSEEFSLNRLSLAGNSSSERLVKGAFRPTFSVDGRTMVYNHTAPGFNWDLWMRQTDEEGPGVPLLTGPAWELQPDLSPDGRLLAYVYEDRVLVRTFPEMGGPWQVAPGTAPGWNPDGHRLFFLSQGELVEVEVTTDPELRFSTPRALFPFVTSPSEPGMSPAFEVRPDGESFVMVRPLERAPGVVVVQNWLATIE